MYDVGNSSRYHSQRRHFQDDLLEFVRVIIIVRMITLMMSQSHLTQVSTISGQTPKWQKLTLLIYQDFKIKIYSRHLESTCPDRSKTQSPTPLIHSPRHSHYNNL
jgi:hypothetical protein